MALRQDNADLKSRMAGDLRRLQATASEVDAIRALLGTRAYRHDDIAVLVDDALFEARLAGVDAAVRV